MSSEVQIRDRVSGSLYGLLVGDALGCPAESMSAAEIEERYDGPITEMVEGARWWRPAGLHSDDGQQAVAILDALLADPAEVQRGFIDACVALLESGEKGFRRFGLHRGTGANFRGTVMKYKQGAAPEEAAVVTAGNGAAMRVAPLALYFRADADALARAVLDVSLVTHRDTRGIAAAGAVADVVRRATRHDGLPYELDPEPTLEFTRRLEDLSKDALGLDEVDREFSTVLEAVLGGLPYGDTASLLDAVVEHAAPGAEVDEGEILDPMAGFAPASVTAAIALFFRAEDYEEAIVECVNLGGDADTSAAILGQMLGACLGRGAIPDAWMDALWARGVLEDRIDALVDGRTGFVPGFSLVELERPWTRALNAGLAARKKHSGAPPRPANADAARDTAKDAAQSLAERQGKADAGEDAAEEQPSLWSLPKTDAEKTSAKKPEPAQAQLGLFGLGPAPAKAPDPAPVVDAGPVADPGAALALERGDITKLSVDAIVNAANSALRGGGGVDGAIHRAGGPSIMSECDAIRARQGGCRTGDAVMTTAGALDAKHVIHAVGPRWRGGDRDEAQLLERAYESSLELARGAGLKTVAFPSISTGSYRFPIDKAARIALSTVARYLERHPGVFDEVRFVLFDEKDLEVYEAAREALRGGRG